MKANTVKMERERNLTPCSSGRLKSALSHAGGCIALATITDELLRGQTIPDLNLLHHVDGILGALQRLIFQKVIEGTV